MEKKKAQRATIRIPQDMHQKLQKEAARRGLSLNAYIVTCLWVAVDEEEK